MGPKESAAVVVVVSVGGVHSNGDEDGGERAGDDEQRVVVVVRRRRAAAAEPRNCDTAHGAALFSAVRGPVGGPTKIDEGNRWTRNTAGHPPSVPRKGDRSSTSSLIDFLSCS